MDAVEPPCETPAGCLITWPDASGQRILEIRGLLVSLKDVVDPGTVCRICHVDREDLELLALIEDELRTRPQRSKP